MNRSLKCLLVLMLYGCTPLLAAFLFDRAAQNITTAVIFCIACAMAYKLLKKRGALDIHKGQVAIIMTSFAVIAVAVYLFSGIYFGFSRVVLLGSLIFTHVIPTVVMIISTEMLRRLLMSLKSGGASALSYIVFVTVEVLAIPRVDYGVTAVQIFGAVILPVVASKALCHYICAKYGSLPNILYRIILCCYPYFVPVRPQIPNAMLAFARIFLPIFILFFIYRLYKKRTRATPRKHLRLRKCAGIACLLLSVSFIMLVAGVGKYKLLVIGSESMSGVMNRGDAVVYEKYTDQTIRTKQIILFERDGVIIVHRVIAVEKVGGDLRYYTKGDANDAADVGYITDDRVIGIGRLTLKYIGYPALWARKL